MKRSMIRIGITLSIAAIVIITSAFIADSVYGDRAPLRPSWPGFAINVVFWGAMVWLMCLGFLALRGRCRVKQNP